MRKFEGKTAIVTGGGSGIGLGLVRALARRGAKVVLADIDEQRVAQAVQHLAGERVNVQGETLDVTDERQVRRVVAETVKRWGRLDYIFNNAGIAVGAAARDCCRDDWKQVLDVNIYGVVHGILAAYPQMIEQGGGHIVNTASIEGLIPVPSTIGYVASKHAVVGISNTLRIEGEPLGVKVSTVCPGFVRTHIFDDSRLINIDRADVDEKLSKAKGMSPDDCAAVILKGVEKNKAMIMVTGHAKFLYALQRLSPSLTRWLIGRQHRLHAG